MLKQTLDILRKMDGEMSQMRTQLMRLEKAQESLERGQAALCAHLRISHISPNHSDHAYEQSRYGDQVDPDHHDEEQASISGVSFKFTFIRFTPL